MAICASLHLRVLVLLRVINRSGLNYTTIIFLNLPLLSGRGSRCDETAKLFAHSFYKKIQPRSWTFMSKESVWMKFRNLAGTSCELHELASLDILTGRPYTMSGMPYQQMYSLLCWAQQKTMRGACCHLWGHSTKYRANLEAPIARRCRAIKYWYMYTTQASWSVWRMVGSYSTRYRSSTIIWSRISTTGNIEATKNNADRRSSTNCSKTGSRARALSY